ncbi:LacI family DNA-binding transcriptional regulator [Microbacterium sp. 179-I 3D3 NHS]|uniref:LacI family DNA-binding transcriptional regulator n=1 Tax=unclassified Microbacterium TaxID=2609290 RepID=UPI0039A10062
MAGGVSSVEGRRPGRTQARAGSHVSQIAKESEHSRPPGMIDVARLAGVSSQTVSRVLRDHPHVSEETRSRVMDAVNALEYRRNNAARALSSGRSRLLGLIQLRVSSYSRAAFADGVEAEALRAGYTVTTGTAESADPAAVADAISRAIDQGVEGVIIAVQVSNAHDRLDRLTHTIPCVTVDGLLRAGPDIVTLDQVEVGRLATEHLLGLGHDTVWHVAGPGGWHDTSGRTQGWRDALVAADREVPPVLHGDWSARSGYDSGQVLGRIPTATAVFAASDDMAFGVLRALHEAGRRVPDDVSVVGVDDIPLAEYSVPPLTTVAQPFAHLGRRSVRSLLEALNEPDSGADMAPPALELIVRGSTAPRA